MVYGKRGSQEPASMNLWIVISVIKGLTEHRLPVLLNTMCAIKSHSEFHMTHMTPYDVRPTIDIHLTNEEKETHRGLIMHPRAQRASWT